MRTLAERIVDDLLEGRVSDWLADKWNDIKAVTGIGSDSFGLGKNTEKGWKPKYRSTVGPYARKRPPLRSRSDEPGPKTWEIG